MCSESVCRRTTENTSCPPEKAFQTSSNLSLHLICPFFAFFYILTQQLLSSHVQTHIQHTSNAANRLVSIFQQHRTFYSHMFTRKLPNSEICLCDHFSFLCNANIILKRCTMIMTVHKRKQQAFRPRSIKKPSTE